METDSVNNIYSADDVLCAALDVGEHILKNGGEIHRVEDTMERIGKSFGAVHVDVFCITSLIVASLRMPDGGYSHQIRRVYKTRNNMAVLEEMNEISRELCSGKLAIENVRTRIEQTKEVSPYHFIFYYLAAILGAGGFAVFFGGSLADGLCAALVGIVMTFVDRHIPKFLNPMIATLLNSLIGGVLAIVLYRYVGIGSNLNMIMIGTIMLVIPGLALGNAIRDMLGGDIVSGAMRLIQSVLIALMIAAGYAAAIMIFGNVSEPMAERAMIFGMNETEILLLSGVVSTVGFSILFNVKPQRLGWVCLDTFFVCLVYALTMGTGSFTSNLMAAFVATLIAEIIARIVKAPVVTFLTPAIIPLVPGGPLYNTISNALFNNTEQSAYYVSSTLLTCLGIAAGIMSASLLFTCVKMIEKKLAKRGKKI